MNRLEAKTVIVTGAALGIGRATCQLLAREGARVALTDLRDDTGRAVTDTIRKEGGTAEFWHLDVSVEAEVQQVFGEIHERFGRMDVLVNNAGISGPDKPTHELSEAEWDKVLAVNAKGVFLCTKHAIPYLRQSGGGSIINLSSIYGILYLASNESKFVTGSELVIDGGYTAQ